MTLESLHNYYVLVIYKLQIPPYFIPSFHSLIYFDPLLFYSAGCSYRGILSIASYEDVLQNFLDTVLQPEQQPTNNNNAIPQRVFLMALDQMADKDETRNGIFRTDLQDFLGLTQPLGSMTVEHNKNNFHGERAFLEIIDICDDRQFLEIRRDLLRRAEYTIQWIESNFMTNPGVRVANQDHFVEIMQTWTQDPCTHRTAKIACTEKENCNTKYT